MTYSSNIFVVMIRQESLARCHYGEVPVRSFRTFNDADEYIRTAPDSEDYRVASVPLGDYACNGFK